MSKMRSSTTLAEDAAQRQLLACRAASTGRITSPMRSGSTMFAMKPMLVAATRVRIGGSPTRAAGTASAARGR